jgi:anti-sigma regulatory factor (Ser/Thr protein kinase)
MKREAQFPAVRTSALSARRFVSDSIVDVSEEISETAALIASELATNCVRHAASAFEIRVEQLPDRIHIEVEDDGRGNPVVRSPDVTDTSGRGLQIVEALADDWGVIPKPETTGKTVWVTISTRTPDDGGRRETGADADGHRGRGRRGGGSGPSGAGPSLRPVSSDVDGLRRRSGFCARTDAGGRPPALRLLGPMARRRRTVPRGHGFLCPSAPAPVARQRRSTSPRR